MHTWVRIHISKICQLTEETTTPPLAQSMPSTQITVQISFLNIRNQASFGKWSIPGLGQGIYKVSLSISWEQEGRQPSLRDVVMKE